MCCIQKAYDTDYALVHKTSYNYISKVSIFFLSKIDFSKKEKNGKNSIICYKLQGKVQLC